MRKKVCVVGSGKIGGSIAKTLNEYGYNVRVADTVHKEGVDCVDASDRLELTTWLAGADAVLCATPYHLVPHVSKCAAELGIAYFDLTEDRQSTEFVRSLKSDNVLVPQCGLAPGAVSVIAANLLNKFTTVKSLDIRVGALPLLPNNNFQYYLTWSTNGLINEYCNLCDAIYDGKRIETLPLEGYEKISVDGQIYECFNTSGGVGSLCESLEGKVEKLTYKTIRYPGHHDRMKFLLEDLNLSKNKDLFVQLFDQEIPQTKKDVVIIMVKVIGYKNSILFEESYFKKIYGDEESSAIQKTTVGGICAAMCSLLGREKQGFVRQEEIDWDDFTDNVWGKVYA